MYAFCTKYYLEILFSYKWSCAWVWIEDLFFAHSMRFNSFGYSFFNRPSHSNVWRSIASTIKWLLWMDFIWFSPLNSTVSCNFEFFVSRSESPCKIINLLFNIFRKWGDPVRVIPKHIFSPSLSNTNTKRLDQISIKWFHWMYKIMIERCKKKTRETWFRWIYIFNCFIRFLLKFAHGFFQYRLTHCTRAMIKVEFLDLFFN